MSISSLNSNLLAQNQLLNQSTNNNANLQSLGAALHGGDISGAKSIFAAISQSNALNSSNNSTNDPTSQTSTTIMGQLGDALQSGNLSQAQQLTSALQTLQSSIITSSPLLSDTSAESTSSGLNDSLFNALSLNGVGAGSASSISGVSSPAASAMVSPQQVIAANMDTFLNNLLSTLKANNSSSNGSSATTPSNSKQNPYGVSAGTNQFSSGLQSLIQQLAKSPSALSDLNRTSSQTTSTNNSGSHAAQVSELQSSYDQLLTSQGGSGGTSSLIGFLENFESNVKNMQSTGGLLNINA